MNPTRSCGRLAGPGLEDETKSSLVGREGPISFRFPAYRISPGSQIAIGGNIITRASAMMLMSTKGMTPR